MKTFRNKELGRACLPFTGHNKRYNLPTLADPDPGSGMNIPDHISDSLDSFFGLKIIKFFDEDLVLDPESFSSWIRDKHPGSATMNLP